MDQPTLPAAEGTLVLDTAAAPDAISLEAPTHTSGEAGAMDQDQQLVAEPEASHANSDSADQTMGAPVVDAEASAAALSINDSLASSVEPALEDVAMVLESASVPTSSTTAETPTPSLLPPPTSTTLPPVADAEVFKVPFAPAPAAATLHGLPADIEHILSLGANEPDPAEEAIAAGKASNYEQVVREMREKAGFASKEGEGELEKVQKEMEEGGVIREVKVEEGEESMEGTTVEASGAAALEKKPVFTTMDDSYVLLLWF